MNSAVKIFSCFENLSKRPTIVFNTYKLIKSVKSIDRVASNVVYLRMDIFIAAVSG